MRFRSGGFQSRLALPGGAGASPTTPVPTQSAPQPTKTLLPCQGRRPWGVSRVAALSGGDRRRRVTMTTRRRSPLSASRSRSPEGPGRARRNHGGESGWEARGRGPEKAGSGLEREREGGGLARVGPASCPGASVHQPVSPSFLASAPPEAGYRSAQPLAHCGCQAAPEPHRGPGAGQSARFPEAPQDPAERGGQAGACAEGSRLGGPHPGARWGQAWVTGSC